MYRLLEWTSSFPLEWEPDFPRDRRDLRRHALCRVRSSESRSRRLPCYNLRVWGDCGIADEAAPWERACYKLHTHTAQKQVVTPLIAKSFLAEHCGNLPPVANAVQKQVGCDLVLARRDEAGGESLKREHAIELRVGRGSQELHQLSARIVTELEDILDGSLSEILPVGDLLIEKALCVSELHGEDVHDDSADRRHASRRKGHRPGLRMLDEPVVPAMLLYRGMLEERLETKCAAVARAHARKLSARQFLIARLMSPCVLSSPLRARRGKIGRFIIGGETDRYHLSSR